MNKHPHEEVILAYYRGEQIEWRFNDGEAWRPLALYRSNKPSLESALSFDYDIEYRIKPITHTVELTQEEIETLICLACRVSSNPDDNAQKHSDSALAKLGGLVSNERLSVLYEWRVDKQMVDGAISFRGDLPK